MKQAYKNPPIIEAACEIHFKSNQPWDWTIPGLLYNEVKDNFPLKRQETALNLQFKADDDELAQKVKTGIARMQFYKKDETALLQVGPDKLAVNHLKPYPKWEVYREMILGAFNIYKQIAKPVGIKRIGLRYINRIDTREPVVQIEDYLLALPSVPKEVPQIYAKWVQRIEIPFDEFNGILILQSGSIHDKVPHKPAFILDLDFITTREDVVGLENTIEWIEIAHEQIEKTFEACITDNARKLFEEVN